MASSGSSSSNRDGTNDVLLSLILFACSAKLWLETLDVHRGLRRRHLGRDHYHNSNSVHASAVRSSESFLASLRQHSQHLLPSCTSAAIQSNRNTIQTASNSQHTTKINQQQQPQEEEDSDEEDYIRKKRISLMNKISYHDTVLTRVSSFHIEIIRCELLHACIFNILYQHTINQYMSLGGCLCTGNFIRFPSKE